MPQTAPDGAKLYEYEQGERVAELAAESAEDALQAKESVELTWREAICLKQQSFLYQAAIAVLLLTAVRFVMTKGQERGV